MVELLETLIPFETARQMEVGDRINAFALNNQRGETFNNLSDDVAGLPTLLIFEQGQALSKTNFEGILTHLRDRIDETCLRCCVIRAITRRSESENLDLHDRLGLGFDLLSDRTGDVYRTCGLEPMPPGCDAVVFVLDPQFRIFGSTGGRGVAYLDEALRYLSRLLERDKRRRLQSHAPVIVIKNALTPEDCDRLIRIWHQPVPVWKTDGLLCDGHEAEKGDFKVQGAAPYKVLQYVIRDRQIQQYLDTKLIRRIKPEVEKAFQTGFSKREDYRVAAYDAVAGDSLAAHRDNPTAKTRHRRFTVSVTLNAEEFEGGALRFREYGNQDYLVETGSAIIWSCALLHEVLPVTSGRRFILGTHFFGQ